MIEALDPKIRLEKNLLRHVLHILRVPKNATHEREHALLVAPHKLLKRGLCPVLRQAY